MLWKGGVWMVGRKESVLTFVDRHSEKIISSMSGVSSFMYCDSVKFSLQYSKYVFCLIEDTERHGAGVFLGPEYSWQTLISEHEAQRFLLVTWGNRKSEFLVGIASQFRELAIFFIWLLAICFSLSELPLALVSVTIFFPPVSLFFFLFTVIKILARSFHCC